MCCIILKNTEISTVLIPTGSAAYIELYVTTEKPTYQNTHITH